MKPLLVSFFTANDDYRQHAERLRGECDALGLEHCIEERPDRGDYLANCRIKPAFIAEMLERHKRPVLWVDVDGSVLKVPDISLDGIGLVRKLTGRRFHVGTVYATPSALPAIRAWARATDEGGWSDESAIEALWLAGSLNAHELPAEYHAIEQYRPVDGAIILHRCSTGSYKQAFKSSDSQGVAGVRYFAQFKRETVEILGGDPWHTVHDTPHYKHLLGQDGFAEYLTTSNGPKFDVEAHCAKFARLVESIKQQGSRKPITVTQRYNGDWLVVDGNHRYAASRFLGVPCPEKRIALKQYIQDIKRSEHFDVRMAAVGCTPRVPDDKPRYFDASRWAQEVSHHKTWQTRYDLMVPYLSGPVADIGAGRQYLRKKVEDYLPVDMVAYSPDTVVLDLDAPFDPSFLKGRETLVFAGVLEHLRDPKRLLTQVADYGQVWVVSYANAGLGRDHDGRIQYSQAELQRFIESLGFSVTDTADWKGQQIWRLERHAR